MATSSWQFGIRGSRSPGRPDSDPAIVGDTGPRSVPDTIWFNPGGGDGSAPSAAGVFKPVRPKLTTLVSFDGADGYEPVGSLIADAAGDLFGTTFFGGAINRGTVFEVAETKHGYAGAPTTLGSFTGLDGLTPEGGLIADAAGDLFGTTAGGGTAQGGGQSNDGTVFEIAKTKHGYASAPTTLVSFSSGGPETPVGGLIADAAGDLFGTTEYGGASNDGTVFEIAKSKGGYASAATTIAGFSGVDGEGIEPEGALIADAAGDLFGTTYRGGDEGYGTVFEIAKTKGGYAGTPTTLVSFDNAADGEHPAGALIADAAGDLFGTTALGGADGYGTVYEIARTKGGYASAPTTLYSFGADGLAPEGGVIIDAAGNLFGTTSQGGSVNDGTVFEIAKTKHGYASTATTLASFTGADGANPVAGLIADAAGNLYATTRGGGASGDGTVFEITNSGFVVTPPSGAAFAQAMASHGSGGSGSPNRSGFASPHETPALAWLPGRFGGVEK